MVWILCVAACAAAAPAPQADEAATEPDPTPERSFLDEPDAFSEDAPAAPNMTSTLARMVLAMVLILGLLVGGLFLVQKFSRRRFHLGAGDRPLRILDKVALGPKSSIVLLKTSGRHLVLGVAEKEISVLMEVELASEGEQSAGFADTLEAVRAGAEKP
jgi:flagellar biogenesis protein FliO